MTIGKPYRVQASKVRRVRIQVFELEPGGSKPVPGRSTSIVTYIHDWEEASELVIDMLREKELQLERNKRRERRARANASVQEILNES